MPVWTDHKWFYVNCAIWLCRQWPDLQHGHPPSLVCHQIVAVSCLQSSSHNDKKCMFRKWGKSLSSCWLKKGLTQHSRLYFSGVMVSIPTMTLSSQDKLYPCQAALSFWSAHMLNWPHRVFHRHVGHYSMVLKCLPVGFRI